MNNRRINLLAISGSLRSNSSNSALLRATTAMAPPNVAVTMYEDTAQLPHFNPDLDVDPAAPAVGHWRSQLKIADGVLICTPEYAKGIPGSPKNALDWIVSSGEFMSKPVAVISASPHPLGGEVAHASLLGSLSMMDAPLSRVPFVGLKLGRDGEIIDEETRVQAKNLMNALVQAMN